MTTSPYDSISRQSDLIRTGELKPSEIVSRCCSRIEAFENRLGAFQSTCIDQARTAAIAADAAIESGHRIGPFHGMPFALKDIVEVENLITTAGCRMRERHLSTTTATIARRLLAAGGILLGKTKTVEFAFGGWGTNQHMGTPWNPWDPNRPRTPGGSSSGSAVAVAAGLAGCAVGTDTGGSVRLPAAWCGIVGLKVTEGILPTDGIVPLSHTLDTPGPLARCVDDVTLMYETLAGRSPVDIDKDRATRTGLWFALDRGIEGLLLGELPAIERECVDQAVLCLYDEALETLRLRGARVETFESPPDFETLKQSSGVIMAAEGYYHHGALYEDATAILDEAVRPRILAGANISAATYIAAHRQRRKDRATFSRALGRFDALLTPTTMTTAVPVHDIDQAATPARFTRAANYLGLCGLSLPMGLTPERLPGALQVMASSNCEAMVLRIGAEFERHAPLIGAPPL